MFMKDMVIFSTTTLVFIRFYNYISNTEYTVYKEYTKCTFFILFT